MIIRNIKLALRNARSKKQTFIISITGLTLAFTVAFYISVFVFDQFGYDKKMENYSSIYRLEMENWALLPSGVGPYVESHFPEIDNYTRIGGTFWSSTLESSNNYFDVKDIIFADGKPFDIFSFEFLLGNPVTALEKPNSIILTESLKNRIFGNKNPVGQTIRYNRDHELEVTAVIADVERFHIPFEAMINFTMLKYISGNGDESFLNQMTGSQNYLVYLTIPGEQPGDLGNRITELFVSEKIFRTENPPRYSLRSFSEIYFLDDQIMENAVIHGNMDTVLAMSFVALFIILIATINFINIIIADGSSRAREVAMKKLSGSGRGRLVLQFMTESFLITFGAFLLSFILVINLYGAFRNAIATDLPDPGNLPGQVLPAFILIFIIVAIAGGLYPALYLSSRPLTDVFRNELTSGKKGLAIRRVLILIQFGIAIFLTIQSMVIMRQFQYMKNRETGFDKEQIISFEIPKYLRESEEEFRESLLENPVITAVTFNSQLPGRITSTSTIKSPVSDEKIPVKFQYVDPEYIDVMGIDIISGRFFTRERSADEDNTTVINETAARMMGYENPSDAVGDNIRLWGDKRVEIIGLARDYHFNSLHLPVEPSILIWYDGMLKTQVKFVTGCYNEAITHAGSVWKMFEPDQPFSYNFMDETFSSQYNSEQRLGRLVLLFTIIAILIGSFGIFGMSSFMAGQMSKSITIRKVLGDKTSNLVFIFGREYFYLVIVASAIAVPLAWKYSTHWLSNFPFKADIAGWVLFAAFASNMIIAIATISFHALRTANSNPAAVLREE